MKQINQYIKESILDDEDDIIQNDDWVVEKWLDDNYKIMKTYKIKNHIIDVDGNIYVKNKKISQLLPEGYKFGVVKGYFDCADCDNLISLEGCPDKIYGAFYCTECKKLKSLIGCPSEVTGYFDCADCENLISLDGCPEIIGYSFNCARCKKLKSLDGIARKIKGSLYCDHCGKKFEQRYIENLTTVSDTIYN